MIYIFGAGGHGRVVLDCALRSGFTISGFVDDDPIKRNILDYSVYSSTHLSNGDSLLWGIGNGTVRSQLFSRFSNNFLSVFDPSAVISPSVKIGNGSVVLHGAIIQSGAEIGEHCIVNTKASVDHDCSIGNYSHIAPGATVCGDVTIGRNCWIGAGATLIQGVSIGDNVVVGAGATVVSSFQSDVTLIGTPARVLEKSKSKEQDVQSFTTIL